MSENSKPIVKDTTRDAKQELDDFLAPISAKMFKPASLAQQTTTPNKPIAKPTKKGQQRKVKRSAASTDKLQSKSPLLDTSILSQLELTDFNVEELETMAMELVEFDFARIPMNKQILYGLKMALGSKKNMHQLGNTIGLILLQLFRPDILETIKKMPSKEDSKKK